jgi:plastocyanin
MLLGSACASVGAASPPPTPFPTEAPTAVPVVAATAVASNAVTIANFAFSPAAVVVPVGTTVTWTNKDVEQHTVTARDKSFDSDVVAGDKSFSFTFAKAGTYDYFCQIHPNMAGRVVVSGG